MEGVKQFINRNILVIAVLTAGSLAFVMPSFGKLLYKWNAIPPFIIAVFICQGMAVKGDFMSRIGHYGKLLFCSFIICYVLAPLLGWSLMSYCHWQQDYAVGFMLMCCMSPTLVSGSILTGLAKGDVTSSLVMTIILNILVVVTIPVNLSWSLGALVSIPVQAIFFKLLAYVLVPALIGYFIRQKKQEWVSKQTNFLKYFPVFCLSVPIFISSSQQVDRLKESWEIMSFGKMILASLLVHGLLLIISYFSGKKIFRFDEASCRALAIVSSQKTVPVTIAVWAAVFAKDYPLALVPVIIFHFTQIYFDGFVAQYWATKT